mmetsp:Transcript_3038/g.8008  ORF Transcript_3038/g.8008 Transcript_3038/m.8008 type:complete len:138 (+) Transcript_3038:1742-2155(+)
MAPTDLMSAMAIAVPTTNLEDADDDDDDDGRPLSRDELKVRLRQCEPVCVAPGANDCTCLTCRACVLRPCISPFPNPLLPPRCAGKKRARTREAKWRSRWLLRVAIGSQDANKVGAQHRICRTRRRATAAQRRMRVL